MPKSPHRLAKHIADAFLQELTAFKRDGYKFGESGRELFEGTQREAFDAYLEGLKAGHREGYYEIPTGVGKTALFIAIIGCYLRATENIPDAPRVLIHEPTTDLVVQSARAFADFMPDIARRMEADDERGREIDWENSQIDVHYMGRKGAKNKPRVLITTYQGQAADERKAQERRTHKPEDFGLVIHDEAHYLTGKKYGPAAVDKFKGAIQLGVTATPEYSTDKTVANKLGHRYYHLPLNTAIERGDLCHVRPIVLKTRLRGKGAINLERARKFFEQQQGRPLSNKQLEQLLNQEARNQAIIKAYLTGSHPDTGERFLGQTGMIFAGGITHCNDFILHTERVLNQPAYRPIKKWLHDEGVALIAPIHSDIPVDGVEVNFGGQRKKCTKDEIKELHRQGKILLIISDQELKLGSDFPMDSFIVDAVDRFSVPDATQRMGRGFRVDRGDKLRNLPPNPNKSCAAINVIDETTHDMYKGTLHYPIHAIEILQGAEHRPPGRRKGALTRFKEHPPEVSESLESLGFEFVTRTEVMRAIAKAFETNQKSKLPDKNDQWWSAYEIRGHPGGGTTKTKQAIAELSTRFQGGEGKPQKDGSAVMEYEGNVIHMRQMKVLSNRPLCFLGQDLVTAGLVQENTVPPKLDGWWSLTEARHKPGGNTGRTWDALDQLLRAFEDGHGERHKDGSVVMEYEGTKVCMQRQKDAGGKNLTCFCGRDLINAGLVHENRLPPKTDDWWSLAEIRHKPGGATTRTQTVLNQLSRIFEGRGGDQQESGSATIHHEGMAIRMQQMDVGGKHVTCFCSQDLLDARLVQDTRMPPKTDEWWSAADISKKPGGNRSRVKEAVRYIIKAFNDGAGKRQPDGSRLIEYSGDRYRVQTRMAFTLPSVCVFGQDITDAGLLDRDTEQLKSKVPVKKDITSGSDHLKRTGRSRVSPEA